MLLDVLLQNESVSDIVLLDPLDGLGTVLHRKNLDPRLDALLGSQVEHLQSLLLATDVRGAHQATVTGKVLDSDLEDVLGHTNADESAVDLEGAKDGGKVDSVGGSGVDDKVERLGLVVIGPVGVLGSRNELVGTHLEGVLPLTGGMGDGNDLGTKGVGEHDTKVAKTADTDDTNTLARASTVADKRREDSETTAKHRSGVLGLDLFGDGEDELLLSSNVGAISAHSWNPVVMMRAIVSVYETDLAVSLTILLLFVLARYTFAARV